MAISRMQQPRQNYGLGSFVKKLTGKVTKPFTKVARKIVPKEIAGIMRVAAPFVPGPIGTLMYLAGTAKQTGRISPVDLALAAAPYAGGKKLPSTGKFSKFVPEGLRGKTLKSAIGKTPLPFTDKNLQEFLVGTNVGQFEGPGNITLPEIDRFGNKVYTGYTQKIPDTQGIFGSGGEMFKIGRDNVGIFDTKAGQKLFGRFDQKLDKFVPSYTKIGAQAIAAADFINTQKQLEKLAGDASEDLVDVGDNVTDSDSYQKFLDRLAALNEESFRVPERFRLPVPEPVDRIGPELYIDRVPSSQLFDSLVTQAKDGGRIGFRFGGAYQGGSGAPGSAESKSSSKSSNTTTSNTGGGGGRDIFDPVVPVKRPIVTNNNDRDNRVSLVDTNPNPFSRENITKVATNQLKNVALKKLIDIAGISKYTNPIGIAYGLKSLFDAYNKPNDNALMSNFSFNPFKKKVKENEIEENQQIIFPTSGYEDPDKLERKKEAISEAELELRRQGVLKADGGRIGFREGTGRRGGLGSMGPDMVDDSKVGLGALGDMADREFKFDAQKFMINKYKEDGTKPNIIGEGMIGDGEGGMEKMFVIETPGFGTMTITFDQYIENFGIPERMNKDNKAAGGLMRTNFAMGSDDDPKPLPEDPTKPINPFGPKPIKPLGDMKMADISYSRKEKAQMLADQLAEEQFGMDFYDLDIRTQMKVYQIALDMIDEGGGNAMGGLPNDRTNFALGTMPTAQESGLGGLPIEADMRYTGGFMPYGAKEKADDVPARLSKNEFVFTADAVRAAGGGSVEKGAQRMYNTMKQLEAKPESKGMMA